MQQVEGGSMSHTLVPLCLRSHRHCIGKIVKFDSVPEDIANEIVIMWTFGAVLDAGSVVNGDASIRTETRTRTRTGIRTSRRNQG